MSGDNNSHTRRNALTGEWVLVSPNRLERPWQGQVDDAQPESGDEYDESCYLCPGNSRANAQKNPDYRGTFVFDNDFPALSPDSADSRPGDSQAGSLFASQPESGVCRVVCYSEKHNLRLATLSRTEREAALRCLINEFIALDERDDINYVQVFENRGQMMGCSNNHPHAQVWATATIPTEPQKELGQQASYFRSRKRPLLLDYAEQEIESRTRIVTRNDHWLVVVPFWAVWPYELLVLPLRAVSSPADLLDDEVSTLGDALGASLGAYEATFGGSSPYSLGFHPRPSDGEPYPEWQFHIHIYPPLLRSATVRKHLVGYEMLAQPQRDLTPELAAERLRDNVPDETSNA